MITNPSQVSFVVPAGADSTTTFRVQLRTLGGTVVTQQDFPNNLIPGQTFVATLAGIHADVLANHQNQIDVEDKITIITMQVNDPDSAPVDATPTVTFTADPQPVVNPVVS